jgi:hypothetical protein
MYMPSAAENPRRNNAFVIFSEYRGIAAALGALTVARIRGPIEVNGKRPPMQDTQQRPQLMNADGTVRFDADLAGLMRFAIGEIEYDNGQEGLGAVPDVRRIERLGMIVSMTPSTFLSLAYDMAGEPKASRPQIFTAPIGVPYLEIDANTAGEAAKTRRHEGRSRMTFIGDTIGYDTPVPVALFVSEGRYGLHADEIEAATVERLAAGAFKQRTDVYVPGPLFREALLKGEVVNVSPQRKACP